MTSTAPSYALCHKPFTIKKDKLGKYVNQCTDEEMAEIEKALTLALAPGGLDKKLTKDAVAIYNKWQEFVQKKIEANEQIKDVEEIEKSKVVEEVEEKVTANTPTPIVDITLMPEYIKLEAERDVYKQLYMDLLKEK